MNKYEGLRTAGLILFLCCCGGCSHIAMQPVQAASASNLEIVVSDPITFTTYNSKNGLLAQKFRDGAIYVGLLHQAGPGPHGFRSTDGGKTWMPAPYAGVIMAQISDGTTMAFEQLTYRKGPGEFIGKVRFSKDGWKNVEGPRDVPLHIPNATGGVGDDMLPFEGPIFWGSVVEMPTGDLLATMYGYFEGDNTPIELPPESPLYKNPKFAKYRTLVLRSGDRGKSWSYLSTVAYDPTVGQEGFCEPSMVRWPTAGCFV